MSTRQFFSLAAVLLVAVSAAVYFVQAAEPGAASSEPASRLAVVWSSGDPEVAHRVCLMYAHGAGKQAWFDEVRPLTDMLRSGYHVLTF